MRYSGRYGGVGSDGHPDGGELGSKSGVPSGRPIGREERACSVDVDQSGEERGHILSMWTHR
eukprot:5849204-Pyramimonas_sp.AAC.1